MFWNNFYTLAILAAVLVTAVLIVEARRVVVRPLSAAEVYAILESTGQEDAVPEGRLISNGISALSGFVGGVAAGVGGGVLYNLVSSNASMELLNKMNVSTWLGSGSNPSPILQEICFQTRSAGVEPEPKIEGRQDTWTPTTWTPTSGPWPSASIPASPPDCWCVPPCPACDYPADHIPPCYCDFPSWTPSAPSPTSGSPSVSSPTSTTTAGTGTGTDTADPNEICIFANSGQAKHRKRRAIMRKIERQRLKLNL